jgi:hypothetical protein
MGASLRAGDSGVALVLIAKERQGIVDISTATTLEIDLISPSGLVSTVAAVLTTDGKDGRFQYVTGPTDLLELGMWGAQGHVVIPGSPDLDVRSAMATFRVERAL